MQPVSTGNGFGPSHSRRTRRRNSAITTSYLFVGEDEGLRGLGGRNRSCVKECREGDKEGQGMNGTSMVVDLDLVTFSEGHCQPVAGGCRFHDSPDWTRPLALREIRRGPGRERQEVRKGISQSCRTIALSLSLSVIKKGCDLRMTWEK